MDEEALPVPPPAQLSDAEYLRSIPARNTLAEPCRKRFDAEAIAYRRHAPIRLTFERATWPLLGELSRAAGASTGPWTYRLKSFLQEIADDLIAKGETDDLMLAVERAEEVRVECEALRIKVRERTAHCRRVSYDPMAAMNVLGMAARPESDLRTRATEYQVATLERFGMSGASEMSRRRASLMLDCVFGRMRQGLATVKQVSHMIARGVDPDEARAMSKDEASERLDVLFGKSRFG